MSADSDTAQTMNINNNFVTIILLIICYHCSVLHTIILILILILIIIIIIIIIIINIIINNIMMCSLLM